jgi:transcriptional regulator with XRE-family HTH domain
MKRQEKFQGRTLAALRVLQNLKQEDLARKAGLSRPTINRLECGRTKYPPLETRQALAEALGVPVETFYSVGLTF